MHARPAAGLDAREEGTEVDEQVISLIDAPRIALVDDHPVVRRGLADLLVASIGADVVVSSPDLEEVLALERGADLVLLDIDLGGRIASVADVEQLLSRGTKVLVVSALAPQAAVRAMLRAGVGGFVSKSEAPEVLVDAVQTVLSEGSWTGPEVAGAIAADPARPHLSRQEERVLVLYASGMKADAVARRTDLSPGTVKTYLKRIRAKYAQAGRPAPSKTDLYREARRDGYITEDFITLPSR